MKYAWMMLPAVLAAVVLAGCNDQNNNTQGTAPRTVNPALVPKSQPPIGDVPVPIGFEMDESKSIDFVVAGSRFANHKYKGGADKLQVKRFYERQMPINRWTLTTSMFVGGDINLDFEKEMERCRVIVKDGGFGGGSHILIRLWTSGPVQLPQPTRSSSSNK